MDRQEFLALARTQPGSQWTKNTICDGWGHYCVTGWVMHSVGVPDEEIIETHSAINLVDNHLWADFDIGDVYDINDSSESVEEVVKGLEEWTH
jgi:hypothetical protein